MTDRAGHFLPPPNGPNLAGSPGAHEGGAMPNLSRESLAAGDGKLDPTPQSLANTDKPDLAKASFSEGGGGTGEPIDRTPAATDGPPVTLEKLHEIMRRQREEREAGGRRAGLGEGDIEALVQAAHWVRSQVDQSEAPPVDYNLVRRATWGQLPSEEAIKVQLLGIRYDTWCEALHAEERRRLKIEQTAENN